MTQSELSTAKTTNERVTWWRRATRSWERLLAIPAAVIYLSNILSSHQREGLFQSPRELATWEHLSGITLAVAAILSGAVRVVSLWRERS